MSEPYKLNDNAHVIFTDGRDVIHTVHLEFGQEVVSGQPFMISADTEEELLSLFYETYTKDESGNILEAVPYPISWNARFDSAERAQLACDLVNAASNGAVQIRYIKHPVNNDWATPAQHHILMALPESEAKAQILAWGQASMAAGWALTREQMEAEGWFA